MQVCEIYLNEFTSKASKDIKGTRWMPWHRKLMKDVASCDKLR